MSRTKILSAAAALFGTTMLAATAGFAHELDVHHWFEHQRAFSDGGGMLLPQATLAAPSNTGARGRAGVRGTETSAAAAAPDCLIEQLKTTEGYIPSRACAEGRVQGLADERWVVDEDKEQRRGSTR